MMNIVYLGIFSSVFNWVYDKILSPVVSFVTSLLSTVLEWLFDSVLMPLLINVLWPLFEDLIDLVVGIIAYMFYQIYACLLSILDTLQLCFDIFAGLEPVTVTDASNASITTEMSLLEAVFSIDAVQTVLWGIVVIAFCLTLFISIMSVMKSMGDLNEQTRPVSKVLSSTMKAMFTLICVPVVSMFLISLSCSVLSSIDSAFAYGSGASDDDGNPTMAAMVWVVSSLEAANEDNTAYNASTAGSGITVGTTDKIRAPFYNGKSDYTNSTTVYVYFDYAGFDYLVGGAGVLFLTFALLIVLLGFIRRIFDVILLILAAPFFVAFMPLDDGEKFKGWQDLFVGKLFGAYGAVMAMELYLIIAPTVMDGTISFGDGSAAANYLIRLVFLVGGGWAVVQAGPSITTLLSFQAGQGERASTDAITSVAGSAYRKFDEHRKEKRADAKADARAAMSAGGGGGGGGENAPYTGKVGTGDAGTLKGAKPKPLPGGARSKINGGQSGTHFYEGSDGKMHMGINKGKSFVRGEKADGTKVNRFMGFGSNKDQKGNRTKIRTPFASFKKNAEGKWKLDKLNLGVYKSKRGEDGKMHATKVSLGVAKFRAGNDGKLTMTRLNLGVAKFRRAQKVSVDANGKRTKGEYGEMFCSQVGKKTQRSYNWDRGQSQTDTFMGFGVAHKEKDPKKKDDEDASNAANIPSPPAPPSLSKSDKKASDGD